MAAVVTCSIVLRGQEGKGGGESWNGALGRAGHASNFWCKHGCRLAGLLHRLEA